MKARSAKTKPRSWDTVRITRNGPTADGHRVSNGQNFTVNRIAPDGTLMPNNGWHLGPKFGHLEYGYCGTRHASQGKTKDVVIIAEASASFPAASREQLYVSAGRGRTRCSLYTDDKHGLLEAVQDTSYGMTATALKGRLIERSRVYEPIHMPARIPPSPEHTHSIGREL